MHRPQVTSIVSFVVLIAGANSFAQTTLTANLTNAQENPPTIPTLSTGGARPASFGTATFTLNSAMTSMTFTATVTNIDFTGTQTTDPNDNLIAAHIHAGPNVSPTVNGPVVWGFFGMPFNDNNPNDVVMTPFSTGVGGTISGKWDAPEGNSTTLAAQLSNILGGRAYINFHTTQFTGGEIRGALTVVPGITTGGMLPPATIGVAYSQTLTASGGTPPYTFAVMSGSLPSGLSLSTAGVLSGTPTGIGTSAFTVGITDSASLFSSQAFSLTTLPISSNFTSAVRIAQVVDGGNFTTQFAIANLEQTQVSFQFKFWGDTGSALNIPIQNGAPGSVAGTLAPGATIYVQTTGTSAPLLQGSADILSTGRVGVAAILKRVIAGLSDSEATVVGTVSGSNIFLPYDNTQGFVTGVAVSNGNASQSLSVSMTFTSDTGAQSQTTITLPAHGHMSFVLPTTYTATAGARGSIHFAASSADLAVVGLRFNPNNSFTSLGSFQ
jgi:CHRD domain